MGQFRRHSTLILLSDSCPQFADEEMEGTRGEGCILSKQQSQDSHAGLFDYKS